MNKIRHLLQKLPLYSKFHDAVSQVIFPLWVLQGKARESEEDVSILVGGKEVDKCYLARQAFSGVPVEIALQKHWRWATRGFVDKYRCDVSVLPGSYGFMGWFQSSKDFLVPSWVHGTVDTCESLTGKAVSESLRSDIRRVKRHDLSYQITTSTTDFEYFYHKMYLPFIGESHGESSIYEDCDKLCARMEKGELELLQVIHQGKWIAGSVLLFDGEIPRLKSQGVLNGDKRFLQLGSIAAGYYFSREYLRSRGFELVDVGASRAQLNDGVLRYKKKWGVRLNSVSSSVYIVKMLGRSRGLCQFLLKNPFLVVDDSALVCVVFSDENDLDCQSKLNKIVKLHGYSGCSRVDVYPLRSAPFDGNFGPSFFLGEATSIMLDKSGDVLGANSN